MKIIRNSYPIVLAVILALAVISNQSIPTKAPQNSLLNAQCNYIMSYFSYSKFTTASYFQVDFTQSDIAVNDGTLNVTVSLNGSVINSNTITSNCTNKVCIIKLGTAFNASTLVETTFGLLRNPKFTASQKITVFVYFGVNSNQTQSVSLSSSIYLSMPIIVNSITQSDYGVGTYDVAYKLNVSFSYIPSNPEISIQIPSQVGYTNIDTNLTFYGTYQNIVPFLTTNMIILSLQSAEIVNPNGFMLLTLYGFRNPRYIGNSNSFNITMVQKKTTFSNNCVTCRVAYLYANSSKLLIISSTTSGDITMNMFTPSSYSVSQNISLTIGIKIVAPIPEGGKFRIILPQGITPTFPVTCEAVYGFTVTSPAYCVYNQTANTIETVNFTIPYLESTGDAIIKIYVMNPKDNRQTSFNFQTLDDQNRKIGKNRIPFLYTVVPLSLNASISKNNTSLESAFTLSSNITISQSMNVSTDTILIILPASQFYNLSAIQCVISSTIKSCTKSYQDSTKRLMIQLSPPCTSVCNSSTSFSLTITNLINPSFINHYMNTVEIKTLTAQGSMEQFEGDIDLKQKNLNIPQLSWVGNQTVGSEYQLVVGFEIPQYIKTYGGYMLINFDENTTFVNVILNGTSYTYPQSLNAVNENNQTLINTLTYYNTSTLWSLKQIKVKLCTNDSGCGSNMTITTLRKSYYPVPSASISFKGQTLKDEAISKSTNDVTAFMPQPFSSTLSINTTTSIANTVSNYILKFTINKLPIDSGLRISFSSKHKIQQNGRCFVELSPPTALGYGIDCQIINSSSISLSYLGDLTLMTATSIDYTVTVVNVLNPPSIMPITYSISTMFNSIKTGTYSASFAISQPYTLLMDQMTTSNSTYGQATNLSIKLSAGYYGFDQLKLYVPKQNYGGFDSLNGAIASSGNYNISENGTHFLIDRIYSMESGLSLWLSNALNTSAGSQLVIEMFVQGYLSSKGMFKLPSILPVSLSASVSSSNRYVGQTTSLSFEIKRVNSFLQQQTMKIFFNSSTFSMPSTSLFSSDVSNSQLYSYAESVGSWSNTSRQLTLQSFKNLQFIPSYQTLSGLSQVNISTFDQTNSIVATTLIDITDIVPNKAKDSISYSFVRTSNESLNSTDIVINFVPRYPSMAKLLKIQLPFTENKFVNGSTCLVGNATSTVACQVYDQQTNSLTIEYPSSNQTKITLKNVLNQFPSSNNLTLSLLTQQYEMIEQSTSPITPTIDFDQIDITCTANTSLVASQVQLNFTIVSPQNYIDMGSKIRLTLPDKLYTRVAFYALKDCEYEISGTKFTGCTYDTDSLNDGKDWIQYVSISNFSYVQIYPNTPVKLTLYLINPWTAYPFAQKSITAVLFNSMGQTTSKGLIYLSSIYANITSFTASAVSNHFFQQTNRLCGQQNLINLTITLPVNIATQTYLYIIVPKAYFSTPNQTGYEIESQNTTHTTIKRLINQCTSPSTTSGLCMRVGDLVSSILKVSNQVYLKVVLPKPTVSFYFTHDNNSVTSSVDVNIAERTPLSVASMVMQRSTGGLGLDVVSVLKYTFPASFNIAAPFKISVTPLTSAIGFINSVKTSKFILNQTNPTNQNLSLSFSLNERQIVLSTPSAPSYDVQLQVDGVNPSFAPNLDVESYSVKIFDDNFIYFTNSITLPSQSKLTPLATGIQLTRSNSKVNTLANYSVSGTLPTLLDNARLVFNQTSSIPLSTLPNFTNVRIGQFLNPLSSNWDTYESVSVLNDTHILFMNNKIKTAPVLESLVLSSSSISSIRYNKDMRIGTEETVDILFSSILTHVDKVNLKVPTFFKNVKSCTINGQTAVSCKSSPISSILTLIQIPVVSSTSKVSFTVTTLEHQQLFQNRSLIVETEYPTQSYEESFNLNVWGSALSTSLSMTSTKVNEQNNIEVKITPIMKINTTLLVYLPLYMNSHIQNAQAVGSSTLSSVVRLVQGSVEKLYTLQFNSTLGVYLLSYKLDSSSLNSAFVLTLTNVSNPTTNQPFYFVIEQQQPTQLVFAHSAVQVKMTTLDEIYVRSAQRNTSKIDQNIQITTQIEIPLTLNQNVLNNLAQQSCIIQMPQVQVIRLPQTSDCQVYLIGQTTNTLLPCKMHPLIKNAIITTCNSGSNKYSIRKGFKNMVYSIIPNTSQKPYVFIGQQYQLAQSNVVLTSFLSPIVTSGSLSLNSLKSSSSVRLQKTVLSVNLTLQNIQEVDCINFRFEKQNYLYSSNDLKCISNGKQADCWSSESGNIMVNISSTRAQSLAIEISGLSNYLRQSNFTIRTLKYISQPQSQPQQASSVRAVSSSQRLPTKQFSNLQNAQSAPESSFGLIDIFYSSPKDIGFYFTSNIYNTRVVVPQNYVSDQLKKIQIFFDDQNLLPSSLDRSSLQFNITSNVESCHLFNVQFSTSFVLNCKFSSSMTFTLTVELFDKAYSDIQLSYNTYSTYIYPLLSQSCTNQQCDKCSTGQDGSEKCFSCRQNYYEHQNGCVETCPNGYTSYQLYMTCQRCSTYCSTCYGLYWNNCLECQNSTLLSDSGQCTQKCTSGYAENGYCIGDNECFDSGCRLCGTSGFCYECLPDYSSEPNCKWEQLLPTFFMSYFAAPFLVYVIVSTLFFLIKQGAVIMTYQVIFAFSLLQFLMWIFIIPALHTKQQAMLLLSMVILRIVIGIVAYETYYKRQINSHIGINEEESLLEKEKISHKQSGQEEQSSKQLHQQSLHFDEDWKSRLVRFLAHTNGIDTYEEFKVIFSSQIRIQHSTLYLAISTGNRLLVSVIMLYVLTQGKAGDLTIMPIVTLMSSLFVLSLRIVKSQKFQQLWQKIRNPTK